MFPLEAFQDTLAKAVALFDGHGVRYHLTGGMTSVAYGDPRMTQALDMVVDNDQLTEAVDAMVPALDQSDFLIEERVFREAVHRRDQFQLFDNVACLKIDVYPRQLIAGELDRSIDYEVFPGQTYRIASRRDIMLAKLVWVSKGSHKGRRDLRYLHAEADESERCFVEQLAAEMSLTDLLAEVLAEPDEIR